MIYKKTIPLMGISALLLLVNLPQADANLCGDNIAIVLLDEFGATVFETIVAVPTGPVVMQITNEITATTSVNCDGSISWTLFNTQQTSNFLPIHSIWYEDLQWTDKPGKVVSCSVIPIIDTIPLGYSCGFGDASIDTLLIQSAILGPVQLIEYEFQAITKHFSAVGGEIIRIDTTSVLVAGTQNTAAWMIPVIVSGIGIGIVIARKF